MSKTKILILSDAPTSSTGLGRITRELAIRIATDLSDVFDVATLGHGGTYSRNLPFPNYQINSINNFVVPELPGVWEDFTGSVDTPGIIFTIWNAGWLWWFSNPSRIGEGQLRSFLENKNIKKWGYFPIDSEGPNGKMVDSVASTIGKFDRILTYTKWAAYEIDRAIGNIGCGEPVTEYLPHGTDTSVFYPRDKKQARATFLKRLLNKDFQFKEDLLLIGICATNTTRKDWGLAFQVCRDLLDRGLNVGLWAHTDDFQKSACWDLLTLCKEFGMDNSTIFTNDHYDDETMAWAYSACNVTLGIGSEGWGLPLAESLACGVPVIHGNYAGGAEFVPKEFLVDPIDLRIEGYYGCKRPVFNAKDWADKVLESVSKKTELPLYIDWNNCWPMWKKWLVE